MRPRTELSLLMLQNIRVPLLRSLTISEEASGDIAKESGLLADLLRRSTEYGIQIEKALDLPSGEEKNKSLRIALTALGAQTLSLQREKAGKTPGENEAKRILSALEPVLAYSEQYVPDEWAIARLQALSADFALLDGQQVQLQQIAAFLPVLQAVAGFSFGQPEARLIREVADRLSAYAAALRERLLGRELDADEAKIVDLVFVFILAALYADCHNTKTKTMTKPGERSAPGHANGDAKGMESIWSAFELRAAMLETLAETFLAVKKKEQEDQGKQEPRTEDSEKLWEKSDPLPQVAGEEEKGEKEEAARAAS